MVKAGQEPWRKKTLSWKLIHDVVPSQARFIEDLSLLPQNHANPISGYTIRIRSRKLRTQPMSENQVLAENGGCLANFSGENDGYSNSHRLIDHGNLMVTDVKG